MKRFSKIIALVLVFVMVLSMTACGGKKAEDTGDKQYTIGINTWGSGVPVLDMFGDAKQYTIEILGHKVSRMSDDFTADKELQNVQNMCVSALTVSSSRQLLFPQFPRSA